MAISSCAIRRHLLVGAFVVASATGASIAAISTPEPGIAQAQCSGGEEADQFTTTCVPYLVPNSGPTGFTTTAANPDMPEIDGIPCTGANSGACIGLSEDQALLPNVTPRSTISSSP
jgi:hypothetical protein